MTENCLHPQAPLGDASEVYDRNVDTDFVVHCESSRHWIEYEPDDGHIRIDEIWNGEVALYATNEEEGSEDKVWFYTALDAHEARLLGNLLVRAAEYAEQQGADDE